MRADPLVRKRLPGWPLLVGLVAVLVVVVLVAAGSGQVAIPPGEVLGSVAHRLGLDLGPLPTHPQGENALWAVRFPRVTLAVLVGACLGVAGALLQGVFGNPLAEQQVIGMSSGAAVGACAAIVFGVSVFGNLTIAVAAFLGGLVTTLAVYVLARSGGRTEVVTLVLMGIAVNAFLTFVADPQAREQIVFWQLGSLNGATWEAVAAVTPLAVLGLVLTAFVAGQLDLLALGEGPARHLGVNVERLLLVASALGGALVMVGTDLLARTAIENAELPLGMLTALVGGPFFFWLLRRTRSRQGA